MLPTMYLTGIVVATLFYAVALGDDDLVSRFQGLGSPQGSPGQAPSQAGHQSMKEIPTSSDESDFSPPLQMSRFCFPARTPSATCRFRCHLMYMEAFCVGTDEELEQSGENKCVCKPKETKQEAEPASEEDSLFMVPKTHKEQEEEKKEKEKKPTAGEADHDDFTIPIHTASQVPESEEEPKHHVVFYIFDLNKVFGQPQDTVAKQEPRPAPPETRPAPPAPRVTPAGWSVQHLIAGLIIMLLLVLITIEVVACYRKQRAKHGDMDTIFKNIPMPNKA